MALDVKQPKNYRRAWNGGVRPTTGVDLIAQERVRQMCEEGWSFEHDDGHTGCQMIDAASSYAWAAGKQVLREEFGQPFTWPWEASWWKPSEDPIRNLAKAGALIAAEIDRLQRKQEVAKALPDPPSLTRETRIQGSDQDSEARRSTMGVGADSRTASTDGADS